MVSKLSDGNEGGKGVADHPEAEASKPAMIQRGQFERQGRHERPSPLGRPQSARLGAQGQDGRREGPIRPVASGQGGGEGRPVQAADVSPQPVLRIRDGLAGPAPLPEDRHVGRRESKKAKKARAAEIAARLTEGYPAATTALHHKSPFQLLVATVLSAQCTDVKVNEVLPDLWARWSTPEALAVAPDGELEAVIHPTGFFNQKARSLRGLSAVLVREHGSGVPDDMDALIELPGVARKTANVVMGTAFGRAEGVVVDTHVKRLAGKRLRLTEHTDPNKVERDLMELLPQEEWIGFSHRLIWHGRQVCPARRPRCEDCDLVDLCPSAHSEQ